MSEQLQNKKEVTPFGITQMAIKNRTTVMVLTAIIFLAGLGAYISMPKEAFPEVVIPQIYVSTIYPGNSPLDIEKLISRPIEKEIKSISGIDVMTSTSLQGVSTIEVKFDFSVTPEEALRKVKDKVDIAMSDSDFPTDLPSEPNIVEMNFSEMMPIMNLNLSGDFSMDQLKEYAEYLEDKIEDLSEISSVDIRGVQDKVVEVSIDLYRMQASEISFNKLDGLWVNFGPFCAVVVTRPTSEPHGPGSVPAPTIHLGSIGGVWT